MIYLIVWSIIITCPPNDITRYWGGHCYHPRGLQIPHSSLGVTSTTLYSLGVTSTTLYSLGVTNTTL
jgi:hypothetical protein